MRPASRAFARKIWVWKSTCQSGLNVFMYYGPTVFKKIFHTQGSFCSIKMLLPATAGKGFFSTLHAMLIWGASFLFAALWGAKMSEKDAFLPLVTDSAELKVWTCKFPEHISRSADPIPKRHSKTCPSMPTDLCDLARLCAWWTELAAQPFCSLQPLEWWSVVPASDMQELTLFVAKMLPASTKLHDFMLQFWGGTLAAVTVSNRRSWFETELPWWRECYQFTGGWGLFFIHKLCHHLSWTSTHKGFPPFQKILISSKPSLHIWQDECGPISKYAMAGWMTSSLGCFMKMFVTIFTFKFVTPLNLGAVFLDIFNYAYGPGHPGRCTLLWGKETLRFLHVHFVWHHTLEVGAQLFGSTVLKSFPWSAPQIKCPHQPPLNGSSGTIDWFMNPQVWCTFCRYKTKAIGVTTGANWVRNQEMLKPGVPVQTSSLYMTYDILDMPKSRGLPVWKLEVQQGARLVHHRSAKSIRQFKPIRTNTKFAVVLFSRGFGFRQ